MAEMWKEKRCWLEKPKSGATDTGEGMIGGVFGTLKKFTSSSKEEMRCKFNCLVVAVSKRGGWYVPPHCH